MKLGVGDGGEGGGGGAHGGAVYGATVGIEPEMAEAIRFNRTLQYKQKGACPIQGKKKI